MKVRIKEPKRAKILRASEGECIENLSDGFVLQLQAEARSEMSGSINLFFSTFSNPNANGTVAFASFYNPSIKLWFGRSNSGTWVSKNLIFGLPSAPMSCAGTTSDTSNSARIKRRAAYWSFVAILVIEWDQTCMSYTANRIFQRILPRLVTLDRKRLCNRC